MILLSCVATSPAIAIQSPSESQFVRAWNEIGRASRAQLASESESKSSQSSVAIGIERRVAADWPNYDTANDGQLDHGEFSQWMNDLRAENGNGPADEAIMQAAFLIADTDKDTAISKDELIAFMMSRNGVERPANS